MDLERSGLICSVHSSLNHFIEHTIHPLIIAIGCQWMDLHDPVSVLPIAL